MSKNSFGLKFISPFNGAPAPLRTAGGCTLVPALPIVRKGLKISRPICAIATFTLVEGGAATAPCRVLGFVRFFFPN